VAERSELAIQTLFRSRVQIQCPGVFVVAVPNAAKRGPAAIRQAKREGLATGFPDVICLWRERGVAAIEFKDAKGKCSLNQVEWLQRLNDIGIPACVSRDPDHALDFLRQCGAPFLNAKRIGDLIPPIMERVTAAAELQKLLRRCDTAAARKGLITAAFEAGAIDGDQCSLLIEAEGLETA
jgi:hypothetical protein